MSYGLREHVSNDSIHISSQIEQKKNTRELHQRSFPRMVHPCQSSGSSWLPARWPTWLRSRLRSVWPAGKWCGHSASMGMWVRISNCSFGLEELEATDALDLPPAHLHPSPSHTSMSGTPEALAAARATWAITSVVDAVVSTEASIFIR